MATTIEATTLIRPPARTTPTRCAVLRDPPMLRTLRRPGFGAADRDGPMVSVTRPGRAFDR